MLKGSIQEDLTIANIHAPKIEASEYTEQILTHIKGETDSNTIIEGNFKTPLTQWADHIHRKSIKGTLALNTRLFQIDTRCIYTHSIPSKSSRVHSGTHRTFSRADHMPGHKTVLSKFKKTETIQSITFNHSAMRLVSNFKNKTGKITFT